MIFLGFSQIKRTMNPNAIIECVPNFSEGRNLNIIRQITDQIESVEGVSLLDVDPGKATNRTVVTFVGHPEQVIEAAFLAISKAMDLIDMRQQKGEHPRMGATDVCPLIPISGISMEETVAYAHKLGERVGKELGLPIYMYEEAATKDDRKNLAVIRAGEYEGFTEKIKLPNWKPDYGPAEFLAFSGATVIGARNFLIAYNVNLNTTSVRRANSVAFDVREKGRIKREGNPITGEIVHDENGEPMREPGMCKSVKAIGWYIEEYGLAQISMNLTDIKETPLHVAFEACRTSANKRGLRVTGSELVGLMPLKVMLDAGKYFLEQQNRSTGISEREIVRIAINSLGLNDLSPFDPDKKIIEYVMVSKPTPLADMTLRAFANETASESPAPGGGSISAYAGAMGVALGTMVANLSAHKRGWDDQWEYFSDWAAKGQDIKDQLISLVDRDTEAFNLIMDALKMPKNTDEEKNQRKEAMAHATRVAIETPLEVMTTAMESYDLLLAMVEKGNPNSASDAGVGALCVKACIEGAFMNIKINMGGIKDEDYRTKIMNEAQSIQNRSMELERKIVQHVESLI